VFANKAFNWENHYKTSEMLQAAFEEETMGNK
jgi:hypothetical protein